MCFNVVFAGHKPAPNYVQRLMGEDLFFTSPKKGNVHLDHPLHLHRSQFLRAHIRARHESGFQSTEEPYTLYYRTMPSFQREEGLSKFLASQRENKDFWRYVSNRQDIFGCSELITIPWEKASQGRWAYLIGAREIPPVYITEDYAVYGGMTKDGYGCFLSYAIPVTKGDLETVEMPDILADRDWVSTRGVKIPRGTNYAIWIRCSDTGDHSGFIIGYLFWDDAPAFYPLWVSLFSAPHVFPGIDPRGCNLPAVQGDPNDPEQALLLAECIAEEFE